MKSCAAGLTVRPFRVKIPTGIGFTAKFNGKALIENRLALNRMSDPGNIVKKRWVASSPICR
jgi:hypothetical protein